MENTCHGHGHGSRQGPINSHVCLLQGILRRSTYHTTEKNPDCDVGVRPQDASEHRFVTSRLVWHCGLVSSKLGRVARSMMPVHG